MSILKPGQAIADYSVDTLIKDGEYNETYRIRDTDGCIYFMKFYDPDRVPAAARAASGVLVEIDLCRGLDHPNVIRYIKDGVYALDGKLYQYIVTNYFSGRLVSEIVAAEGRPAADETASIFREMLAGLGYLHGRGLVHNDITPRNVMYDPETRRVQLIDMGHLAHADSAEHHYQTADLTPFYRSPESLRGLNDPAGDVFAAGAVAYALLTGHAPWEMSLDEDKFKGDERERHLKMTIHLARKAALDFSEAPADTPAWLKHAILSALAVKKADRASIDRLIEIIDSQEAPAESPKEDSAKEIKMKKDDTAAGVRCKTAEAPAAEDNVEPERKRGKGFADVAGMDELKDLLQKKVLFILKNKEKAEKYRLTPPNGMLLYGPPGCGKSYFAEKFAEESGFNYKFVKASDLGSIYVHGGQGKIAELFDKARKKSPMIICFDEFDAMVPNRTSRSAEHISGEVNEFLSQLNNCSRDGIFVIGTTNQPEMIDPAVLRKGRVDISVYIPAPDHETRKLMFDLYLKDRPCDTIDTGRLAELTDKYVASDIAFIVNDAAMIAAFRDELITQESLENSVKTTRPSLTEAMLEGYEAIRRKLENTQRAEPRARVGFVQYQ